MIYKIMARVCKCDCSVPNSCSVRFPCLQWAVQRLAEKEKKI